MLFFKVPIYAFKNWCSNIGTHVERVCGGGILSGSLSGVCDTGYIGRCSITK